MLVIYQDSNATYKRIYINDGTDLLCSSNSFSVNDTEATAYANYNNITPQLGNAVWLWLWLQQIRVVRVNSSSMA
jgi:hypothetical protein